MDSNLETKNDSFFDKETFNIVKGVAVILLFFHHFFTFPDFHLPEYNYSALYFYEKYFQFSTNMCVAVFAFLTGYGFCFSNQKGLRSLVVKAEKVLIVYWIIYLLLFFFAICIGDYNFDIRHVVLEFFGFSNVGFNGDIITFFWYMPFYVFTLFFLPVCFNFVSRFKFVFTDILFAIIVPVLLFSFLGYLCKDCFALKRFFVDLMLWFPCVMMGSISAKHALFQQMDDYFNSSNVLKPLLRFFIPVTLIVMVFYGMYKLPGIIYPLNFSFLLPVVFNMSVCYVLFLIYAVIKLFDLIKVNAIRCTVAEFGKYSLYMWLIHGIFFNAFKQYTQPILFISKNPLLVLFWGLGICLFLSKTLEALLKRKAQ